MSPLSLLYFFFFQAEDGIRDYKVTGVQTCALPICLPARPGSCGDRDDLMDGLPPPLTGWRQPDDSGVVTQRAGRDERSEERRVGKECRTGGAEMEGRKKRSVADGERRRIGIEEECL